jgi:hypothetical protein
MRLPMVYWLIAAAGIANLLLYVWPEPPPPESLATPGSSLGRLVLLKELDQRGEREVPRPMVTPAIPEGEQSSSGAGITARCWLAGPVEDESLSARLAAEFAAAGVSMDLVLQTTEADPIHWVFIRTAGSQADVRRLSRVLRDAGWDNFPITDGPLAGSLSMGLFRSQVRATAVRDKLLTEGYAANVYERATFREQPWISLDDTERVALDWPGQQGVLPGYREMRLVAWDCGDRN